MTTLTVVKKGDRVAIAADGLTTYDSPRDTGAQLTKFLDVLALHRKQVEEQMADLQANLDEIKVHQREARALLAKADQAPAPKPKKAAAKPRKLAAVP